MLEERSGHSSDLPSIGTSGRSAHSGGFPGLLPDGDVEASVAATCSGIDTPRRARETRCDPNVGRVVPHHRWPPAGHAALHRTGPRAGASAASAQVRPAATIASAHHSCSLVRSFPPTQNVVETFGLPLLKAKGFPASDVPNCEGWVKGHDRKQAKRATNYAITEAARLNLFAICTERFDELLTV